jgi:hypothetical protein
MSSDLKAPEDVILARLLRLNATVYGLVTGLIAGTGLLAATLWLVAKGGPNVGEHLKLLGHYFPGYTVTTAGAFIGFAYAAVLGFVVAYGVAMLYNRLVGRKEPRDA